MNRKIAKGFFRCVQCDLEFCGLDNNDGDEEMCPKCKAERDGIKCEDCGDWYNPNDIINEIKNEKLCQRCINKVLEDKSNTRKILREESKLIKEMANNEIP